MHIWPLALKPISNREDFLLTLGLFDDDTALPINLSGTTGSGTSNSWTVNTSGLITSSSTSITIPTFPIGNQLSALALTVPASLAITAGSPITLTDGLGRSLTGYVTSYNSQTGALVCQIGMTFQFEIRSPSPRELGVGYGVWYDVGILTDTGPIITASLGNNILITDVGFVQILIPESIIKTLNPLVARTFMASMTMFDGANTRQLFVADLPLIYGGVTN